MAMKYIFKNEIHRDNFNNSVRLYVRDLKYKHCYSQTKKSIMHTFESVLAC